MQNHKEAISDFTHSIELQPDDETNYHSRGQIHFEMGNYSAALADFNCTIDLCPEEGSNYSWRGLTHHALGNYDEAKVALVGLYASGSIGE
jgi:tetratricopeptide (TPR) repeat protein